MVRLRNMKTFALVQER